MTDQINKRVMVDDLQHTGELSMPYRCAIADVLAAALDQADAIPSMLAEARNEGLPSRRDMIKAAMFARHSHACDDGYSLVGHPAAEAAVDAILALIDTPAPAQPSVQEAAKVLLDMLALSDGVPKIDEKAAQSLWDRVQHAGGFYPVKEFLLEVAGEPKP